MALDTDSLVERRRLKRRLSAWRLLAVLALVAAALLALAGSGLGGGWWLHRPQVAEIDITGIIREDAGRDATLARLAADPAVRAVIVRISSPGGTTYGGETLYKSLRGIAARKPVVAVIGTIGTSAAYLAAIAADHIVAGDTSITGSVGVLMQTAEFSRLLDKLGVSAETLTSGALKAEPSPFKPISEQTRVYTQALINETAQWFLTLVTERRHLTPEQAARLADGRVVNGHNAANFGLIDQIGTEITARQWLASNRGISMKLPLRKVGWEDGESGWRRLLISSLVGKAVFPERLILDGLVSLWHPEIE